MNERIKIFIVEYDCVNLITLMLWLDQFPEFDVLGTAVDAGSIKRQINDLKPDVVLLDIATPGPEDIPQLREIKSVGDPPAVLLLYQGTSDELKGPLMNESDGYLGTESTLGDMHDAIVSALKRRRVVASAACLPIAKAG